MVLKPQIDYRIIGWKFNERLSWSVDWRVPTHDAITHLGFNFKKSDGESIQAEFCMNSCLLCSEIA